MSSQQKPQTIEQYIDAAPEEAQPHLRKLYECLRKAAPGAEESIKWSVPTFSYDRILFTFAAYKYHINFYPTPAVTKEFSKSLEDCKTEKSSIQLPLQDDLPIELIRKIAEFRVRDVKENDAKWMYGSPRRR